MTYIKRYKTAIPKTRLGDSELMLCRKRQYRRLVYDVSSHNGGAVFESLSTLLGSANLSTLIPTSVRLWRYEYSGFIQGSSDNKYVQYRLMNQTFSTTESNWQGINDESLEFIAGIINYSDKKEFQLNFTDAGHTYTSQGETLPQQNTNRDLTYYPVVFGIKLTTNLIGAGSAACIIFL